MIYPPLSALPQAMPGSGLGMTLWLTSMTFFIVSSLMGGINYICTIINLRTRGMTFTRMPLTIWSFFLQRYWDYYPSQYYYQRLYC